jgi:hypothetical protein
MAIETDCFASDEMGELMDRMQELLDANVLCMFLCHPSGRFSLTCPPDRRAEVMALLRAVDWSKVE